MLRRALNCEVSARRYEHECEAAMRHAIGAGLRSCEAFRLLSV